MKEWFTIPELAEFRLPDMPTSVSKIHELAIRANWKSGPHCRKTERRGGGFEYHMAVLPHRAKLKLAVVQGAQEARDESRERREQSNKVVWDALTEVQRAICHTRHGIILAVEDALDANDVAGGRERVCKVLRRVLHPFGISTSTYYNWRNRLQSVDREDWLYALAPRVSRNDGNAADGEAHVLQAIIVDLSSPNRPSFSTCYRRLLVLAEEKGWTVPSERTLRRRVEALR